MEVTDWDRSARVLSGLQPPLHCPRLYDQQYNRRWPNRKVQFELKTVAVRLYNHQKMTPMFQTNVSDGKNTLAYMLCASYEPSPPSTPEKNERPKLKTSIPLPLGHWDRLYYFCIAEIRSMYLALQQQFGISFENGTTILHNAGVEGASGASRLPISAIGLASALEDMWDTVNDVRLTSALDLAVRIRHAEDQDSDDSENGGNLENRNDNANEGDFGERTGRTSRHTHGVDCDCVAVANGLVDVHSMTPEDILQMVWAKEAAEASRKSGRRSEEQTLLARCRAEVRKLSPHKRSASKSSNTFTALCKCKAECHCRQICNIHPSECACAMMRNKVCDMISHQEETHGTTHYVFDSATEQLPNNVLGAVTNDVAQMQVAALAEPDPFKLKTLETANKANEEYDRKVLGQHGETANTSDSDLAYDPSPCTPSRGGKDMYPLGYYADHFSQRCPPFRSIGKHSNAAPPVYGASFYNNGVPNRKPVPAPSTDPPEQPILPASEVRYPAIPPSESQGMFTRSFPAAAAGNPRNPDHPAADYTDLLDDTYNAMRPFTDEQSLHATVTPYSDSPTLRPNLHTANTSPPYMIVLPKRRTGGTGSSNSASHNPATSGGRGKLSLDLSKPIPPLPQPDFIAPRQAQKQRWVPAGGYAKLSERQEIEGPAFKPLGCEASGTAMPKEELYARLNDPDFLRNTFGEEAVAKVMGSSERPSMDASPKSKRSSGGKKSRRDSQEMLISKRDRADSNGNMRFEKLRRVFSRKTSQCD